MQYNKAFFILVISVMLSACSWVKLSPEGEKVNVSSFSEVANCKKAGSTTVSVKSDVAGIERSQEDVSKELEILARNAAPDLEGDTIVAKGSVVKGKQSFDVYRCQGDR